MNSPMTTALALSTSSSYAAARRDRHVRRQITGASGSRRLTGRHRFRGGTTAL